MSLSDEMRKLKTDEIVNYRNIVKTDIILKIKENPFDLDYKITIKRNSYPEIKQWLIREGFKIEDSASPVDAGMKFIVISL